MSWLPHVANYCRYKTNQNMQSITGLTGSFVLFVIPVFPQKYMHSGMSELNKKPVWASMSYEVLFISQRSGDQIDC